VDIMPDVTPRLRLSELVDRAPRGEEIIIARNGKPQARLVPLARRTRRMAGRGAGQWKTVSDFNTPLSADVLEGFQRWHA
jgi:prevent-host-death family protein